MLPSFYPLHHFLANKPFTCVIIMTLLPWFHSVWAKIHEKRQKLITAICWKYWKPLKYTRLRRSPLHMTKFLTRKLNISEYVTAIHLENLLSSKANSFTIKLANDGNAKLPTRLHLWRSLFWCWLINLLLSNIHNTFPIQPQLVQSCRSCFRLFF